MNPTSSPVTTASGHEVAAGTYFVAFTPIEDSVQTLGGVLPDATGFVTPSWLDDNGVPKRITFGWTGATGESTDVHIVNNVNAVALTGTPAATATELQFISQPIDSEINAAMTNPDSSVRHVTVGGFESGGASPDPNYTGTVTLGFGANPGSAQFVVGGSPTATMTAVAVDGVADFSPVIINASGFHYTLTATDSPALTGATSVEFAVAAAATPCPAGQTCTAETTSPGNGEQAQVQGNPGSSDTIITASYGGNVFPLFGCPPAPASAILTFSGD